MNFSNLRVLLAAVFVCSTIVGCKPVESKEQTELSQINATQGRHNAEYILGALYKGAQNAFSNFSRDYLNGIGNAEEYGVVEQNFTYADYLKNYKTRWMSSEALDQPLNSFGNWFESYGTSHRFDTVDERKYTWLDSNGRTHQVNVSSLLQPNWPTSPWKLHFHVTGATFRDFDGSERSVSPNSYEALTVFLVSEDMQIICETSRYDCK